MDKLSADTIDLIGRLRNEGLSFEAIRRVTGAHLGTIKKYANSVCDASLPRCQCKPGICFIGCPHCQNGTKPTEEEEE